MTMRLDLSANPGADSIRDHIAELERELDAAKVRETRLLGLIQSTHLVLWEQRLTRELIAQPDKFYIEFSLDGLLRAAKVQPLPCTIYEAGHGECRALLTDVLMMCDRCRALVEAGDPHA